MGGWTDHPPYPSGLRLAGRRVVVVGGGHVAQRRVPGLLAAGRAWSVVSPEVTPAIEGLAPRRRGHLGRARLRATATSTSAWYVIAATDDPAVNEAVTKAAEARRIFCVRADDATAATAWTPAVGRYAGLTVAVLGNAAEPRRTAAVRDEILTGLREGTIARREHRDRSPGVVLVGGGPGDPELISVAGRRALMEADVVVADRLAPRELLGELPADDRAGRRREAAARPVRRAGGDQPADRRARPRRPAGGAVQGWRQLRVRPRLRGGRGLPRRPGSR